MVEKKKNPADYFIIDTRTRRTEDINTGKNVGRKFSITNLELNDDYARLKGLEKARELNRDPLVTSQGIPPNIGSRAANLHDISHMTPEVFEFVTDENGQLFIPKDKEKEAKKAFEFIYKLDNLIELNPFGVTFDTKPIKERLDREYAESKKR